MKVNHIKQLFVALFLLLSAGTATAAQWKLAKTNLNTAGSKDTLTLVVSGNSFSFSSFQVDFALPDGVLLDGTPILGELADGHALTWSKRTDGSFRCVVYSAENGEMKAPEGAVLRIPVVLAASFEKGTFTAKNGILSNKKSVAQRVTDLNEDLRTYKERAKLVVNVSGLEQVINPDAPAELGYTTIPSGKTLDVAYFKDDSCKVEATDADRKKEGILYVKLSYSGDDDYAAFKQVYVMSLTSKKAIAVKDIEAPKAGSIKAGQLLSASLLTGGSVKDGDYTVAGTFAWTDGNTVMPAGKSECSVTFYPDNSSYYNTAEVSVEVEVIATYLVTAVPTTGGVVKVLGKTEDNVYVKDQKITLVATPLPNYQLDGWSVTPSGETLGKKDTIFVTANANKTYSANFTPILHKVSIDAITGNGSLSVVTVKGAEVASGASLQQGTVLQIVAKPDVNSQLKSLTINGNSLKGDKVTLMEALKIHAEFEAKPASMALVSIEKAANGSILLYKEDGSLIASGSTVPVNSKIRAVALPDAGYSLNGSIVLSGVTASTDGLFTVNGDVLAKAAFSPKKYKVKASAVSSNQSQTSSGTITLEPSGEQPYGTEVRIAKVEGQNGARLLTILANGKEITKEEVLTVTGDLTVTAIFDHRVDIKKEYILWPYQEYYYSGVSRNFVPFASQTYAGFSFEVLYQKDNVKTDKAIDAGEYTVLLHRDEDGLYNKFDEEYDNGLVINKSKVSVLQAPEGKGDPKTRPSEVTITKTETDGITKYVIEPKNDVDKNNYEGTVYYHSTKPKVEVSFGVSILRAAGEPTGYVRVTNGGLPYDPTNGKISIPGGIEVTLEAVPAEGAKFSKWSDGNMENPRTYTIKEGSTGVTPEFIGKADLTFALAQSSSKYNGTAQIVTVTGEGDDKCQITFFFDEACKQQPAILKNVGTYYVRVYRPADEEYNEYDKIFQYTIEQAKPTVTWPSASGILSGQKLSESVLQGGDAVVVAGTFAWSNPNKVITEKGKQGVTFTPTDPNYKPVSGTIEVDVVSATSSTEDPDTPVTPVDPVDPADPENPDKPDVPTGVESIEEGMSLYAANQSLFVDMPQPVAMKVVDVAGIVIYEGTVQGKMEIPVGHAGVYFLRCTAVPDTSFVKKIIVP
ncbi:MAG: hypothetical protein PHC95_09735 [Parabacteroides sp.]|nr:hypothetical protein [Parabacteroides sp.]